MDAGSISMATQQKKQRGGSPERRKGSGETLLPGRARGHRSSSTGEELGFPPQGAAPTKPLHPGSSGCKEDPTRGSSRWGPSSFPGAGEPWLIAMQIAEAVPCP